MDCKTARLLLDVAHPRAAELAREEAELLEAHLLECAECGPFARAEQRLDGHLGAALRAVTVPLGLRDRLHKRLKAERAVRTRQHRLRYYGGLAAAAVLLLAVTAFWLTRPLPVPNLAGLHAEPVLSRAEDVERHFADLGVRTLAPPQFNYKLLTTWHLVEFQGRRRVPHLHFLREGVSAEVYILSARQFDRAATLEQGRVDSGGYTVEACQHPHDPQVFYLIKYKGPLQHFLVEEGRPTT